ncbi:MAG: BMP family ABC transporter substrate-binding protein [Oscillospiraceae bacterium]|nr:BMP family ABC transporter substrate-binding protein [Oscillospiraceae bacterium]
MADYDSSANYKQARAMGRHYLSEHSDSATKGYLYILDDLLDNVEICGEINLGTTEIPIHKILGTRTSARSNAFAGNFMPLLPENTEFGAKWCKLYESHIREGIREPIKVYEYLNRYFVQEGNKRVSVLKYLGAVAIEARVTRLIPKRDESNKQISIYYEFLDFDRRATFDNLWFSHRGGFTGLVNLVETWQHEHPECKTATADLINASFKAFRLCYREAGFGTIPITSGDAFLEYLKVYGFKPDRPLETIREQVKSCEAQFKLVSVKDPDTVNTVEQKFPSEKAALSFFSRKPRKLKVAFAFESTPEKCLWTYDHDVARKRLERNLGDKISVITRYQVPNGENSYGPLKELMEEEPDILFATSPNMSAGALRLSIENPDKTILNCDFAQPKKNIMTYYAKFYEAAFLCGVMAGSMTRTGLLGYTTTMATHPDSTFNLNAFCLGAQLVNPTAHVVNLNLYRVDMSDPYHMEARKELSQHGVDIAMCIHQPNTPLVRKGFPGVYAQLYLLQTNTGHPRECIGAAAVDWSVLYNDLVGDSFKTKNSILDITRSGNDSSVHFGWGLNTGILDVLGVDSFMGHNAIRLLNIFKDLIATGKIHPFEGPLYDRDHNLILEKFGTLNLLEIQSMKWLHEAVVDSIDLY